MKKIALRLRKRNADEIITFGRKVKDAMSDSADVFVTPDVPIATQATALTALQIAQEATIHGGVAETAAHNAARMVVEENLRKLANYVENLADGNVDIIYLAGMDPVRKGPRRYETIDVPADVRTENRQSGVVTLRWEKVHNAKSYIVEYCADPIVDDLWKVGFYSSAAFGSIGGLVRLKDYWFRVRAIGTGTLISDWTSPVKQAVV